MGLFNRGFASNARPPFVGKIISHTEESKTFDDGRTRESFKVIIEPLDWAIESTDGMLVTYWPYSDSKASAWYKIKNKMTTAFQAAFGTSPTDIADYYNRPMHFQRIEPENDEFWGRTKEEFRAKGFTIPVAPAPSGWEQSVPEDLRDQKLAAMGRAAAKAADSTAGDSSPIQPTVLGTANGADSDLFEAMVLTHKDAIMAVLDGQSQSTIIRVVGTNELFKSGVPSEVYNGILAGKVQKVLEAKGLLSTAGGVYKVAVPVPS